METGAALAFFFATGASIIYGFLREQGNGRKALWLEAAEAAGLAEVELSRVAGITMGLRGKAGPLRVHLEEYRHGKEEFGNRVTIRGLGHGPEAPAFRRETLGTVFDTSVIGRGEVQLGDDGFDDAVYLRGAPAMACAVFDADTRRIVAQMMHGSSPGHGPTAMWVPISRATLSDGVLRVEVPSGQRRNATADALPGLVALAGKLAPPEDVPARLAQNLRSEPHPGVRLANLHALLETYPRHRATREALRAALEDPSAEVRLCAALALEDRETLTVIAQDEGSYDTQAARAIEALGERLAVEPVKEILSHALRARRLATARACLVSLGRKGAPAVIEPLRKVLAVEKGELAGVAAAALGHSGQAAAEAPLLLALNGEAGDARVAVAEALARVGTAAAVMPLREAAERIRDGDFRRAARQAVAAIQARQSGASPGQLTLAAGEIGQVSLLQDETGGHLSLTDPAALKPDPGGKT
jgi:HEAT repeat protein